VSRRPRRCCLRLAESGRRALDSPDAARPRFIPASHATCFPSALCASVNHGRWPTAAALATLSGAYQPGDALDIRRFLKDVFPGTTPLAEQPEVYTARAVHERFLGAPGLRLVPDGAVVRQTILKSVEEAKTVVRLADFRAYDAQGCVEGAPGQRRRGPGKLTTLALDDSTYIARTASSAADSWVKEDAPGYGEEPAPPSPPSVGRTTATSWATIVQLASERPIAELELLASTPAAAAKLPSLAQPLGAESLSLSLTVGGDLKDGGAIHLAATEVKPSHPIKPLAIGHAFFNAMAEGGTYEASLKLAFGPAGRTGLGNLLQELAAAAPAEVSPRATFERPVGGRA